MIPHFSHPSTLPACLTPCLPAEPEAWPEGVRPVLVSQYITAASRSIAQSCLHPSGSNMLSPLIYCQSHEDQQVQVNGGASAGSQPVLACTCPHLLAHALPACSAVFRELKIWATARQSLAAACAAVATPATGAVASLPLFHSVSVSVWRSYCSME